MLAFGKEEWQGAITPFEEITRKQAGYKDVDIKLPIAKKHLNLISSYTEGMEYYRAEKWEDAIRAFERVIEIDANYDDIQTYLASAKELRKRSEVYRNGKAEYDAHHWAESVFWFRQIPGYGDADIRLKQSIWQAELEKLYNKGMHERQRGKWIPAKKTFQAIEKLDSSYKDVQALLAEVTTRISEEERLHRKKINWEAIGAIAGVLALIATIIFSILQNQHLSPALTSTATPTPREPTTPSIPTVEATPPVEVLTNCLQDAEPSMLVTNSQHNNQKFAQREHITLTHEITLFEMVLDTSECSVLRDQIAFKWSISEGVIEEEGYRASYNPPPNPGNFTLKVNLQVRDTSFARGRDFILFITIP